MRKFRIGYVLYLVLTVLLPILGCGSPPLEAVQNNDIVKLESLLDKGTDVNTTLGSLNSTLLYEASFRGHSQMVEMLLDRGADVNARTNEGATSLYVAAQNGHLETVRILLANGADIETGFKSRTPLHIAAQNGHPQVVQLLIENGADISAKTRDAHTALALAAQWDRKDVFFAFMEAGAELDTDTDDPEIAARTYLLAAEFYEEGRNPRMAVECYRKAIPKCVKMIKRCSGLAILADPRIGGERRAWWVGVIESAYDVSSDHSLAMSISGNLQEYKRAREGIRTARQILEITKEVKLEVEDASSRNESERQAQMADNWAAAVWACKAKILELSIVE